jgi:hypothetical protein
VLKLAVSRAMGSPGRWGRGKVMEEFG